MVPVCSGGDYGNLLLVSDKTRKRNRWIVSTTMSTAIVTLMMVINGDG